MSKFYLELKNRLILTLVFGILTYIVIYYYKEFFFYVLIKKAYLIDNLCKIHFYFILTGVTELFYSFIFISMSCAFLIFLYYVFYHIFCFLSSAFFVKEYKVLSFFLKSSLILFLLTTILTHFIGLPYAWVFFLHFQNSYELLLKTKLYFEIKVNEYVIFCFYIYMCCFVLFQLILLFVYLFMFNISGRLIQKYRKFYYFMLFFISAFFGPFDVNLQLISFLMLVFVYECCNILFLLIQKFVLIWKKIETY